MILRPRILPHLSPQPHSSRYAPAGETRRLYGLAGGVLLALLKLLEAQRMNCTG
jgi:hypothetical protein